MAITTTEFARGRSFQRLLRNQLQVRGPLGPLRPLALTATAVALAWTPVAGASEFKFVPNVTVSETYTDNVGLNVHGQERSDFVTTIAPGFTVFRDSARLQLRAAYSLQALFYLNNSSGTTLSNLLDASAHGTLVQDLLFFDARAVISQQNTSAFGSQAASNINVNNNRVETRSYSISPYLEQRFGSVAVGRLRYAHEALSSGDVNGNNGSNNSNNLISGGRIGLGNSSTDRMVATVASGPVFRTFNWGATASTQKTRYTDSDSVSQSSASANVGYLLGPSLRLTAAGGYEKDTYVTIGEKPQGAFYNAGFIWTPSSRTNVTATAGHRFFGPTYALAISHRARLAAFNLLYNEDITSSQAQAMLSQTSSTSTTLNQSLLATVPDPLLRQRLVDNLIQSLNLPSEIRTVPNALSNRYFLQKNLQASVAANGIRNTVIGSLFVTRREPQSGSLPTGASLGRQANLLDDDSRSIGASGVWSYKLSPRTLTNANLSYTRTRSLTTDVTTNYKTVRLGVTSTFQPKLNGSLELRHTQQDSDLIGSDIRENAITASMRMQF